MTKLTFPSELGTYFSSEVSFNTKLFTNNQGYEERIPLWHKPRRRFYPTVLELRLKVAQELEKFFVAVEGKNKVFTLQDNNASYQVRFEQDQLTITQISQKLYRVSEFSMVEVWEAQ